MRVKGLVWLGVRTDKHGPLAAFFSELLGLQVVHDEPGSMVVLEAPNGDVVEIFFDPGDEEHSFFTTGPVAGFLVDDVNQARAELEAAGVELLGEIGRSDDYAWQHFRGPDGNVYEVTSGRYPSGDARGKRTSG